jgi:hypothetical protein
MGQIVTVNFRGDTLIGFDEPDGKFVAVKPLVDGMGLAWHGQYERLNRDPILSKGIRVMRMPFGPGGAQDVLCLRLDFVKGWLFTVDSNRVKDEEVRARVIAYQEECYAVLDRHFSGEPRDSKGHIEPLPMPGEDHQFPHWPLEELRAKKSTVDMYVKVWGTRSAQWIAPRLGFPVPPPEFVDHGRQLTLVLTSHEGDRA